MTKRHNWGRHQSWSPQEAVYPKSLRELCKEVHKARLKGYKIRAAGTLHSFNRLCATDGVQLHLDHLSSIIWIDTEKKQVKAQGGITIKRLLDALAAKGLTLPNQGYIVDQSIAGAIATATHGSGQTGTLSSFVEEIDLIDSHGNVRTLSPRTDEHLFSAAVVNLGCLGIVYAVTLRCTPLENVRLTKTRKALYRLLPRIPHLLESSDYFQISTDPYSQDSIEWRFKQTKASAHGKFLHNLQWLLIKTLAVFTFDLKVVPSFLLPTMMKIYYAVSPFKSCVDASYRLLSPRDEGHYIEEEIAVPFQFIQEAVETTKQIIQSFTPRTVAIMLIRFADPDPYGYLSPAYLRQTAYISLIAIARESAYDLFREVEEALYTYQGRPHWGKVNFLTRKTVERLYGDNYYLFAHAKQELDPHHLFSNEYIQKLF